MIGGRARGALAVAFAFGLAASFVAVVAPVSPALASGGTPAALMPSGGQFMAVPLVKTLDTRDGTGGVPVSPVAPGAAVTFSVTGVGQVPAGGVADVYVEISALNPAGSGALLDYSSDVSSPGIFVVPFAAGQSVTVSDMVQVGAGGQITVKNSSSSSGATDVLVTVAGYVLSSDPATSGDVTGDTYVSLPYAGVVDTRTGYGAPQAQIPAGGTLTVQVTGAHGVPSDADGAALYLGTANETQSGFVTAYPAGGSDSGYRVLSYTPGQKVRNLFFGSLSASGQITLANHGSAPVDMMVAVQGYLVSPLATEAGSSYQDVAESRIVDTRDGTGGVASVPVPANGSITFTVTGTDGIPVSGVTASMESVAALNPTATGYLSVYPADGSDPGNAALNFSAGDSQDNDLTAAMVSGVSATGRQTITNHSSGTVDVVVAVRGYYAAPVAPQAPGSVSVSVSGTTATVTWDQPAGDGGAAITGYTVTASPDTATAATDGVTLQATLTGLANAATDVFSVTATNAAGTSNATTYAPLNVVTGTVLAPDGTTPVPSDQVTIYTDAPEVSGSPSVLGTATTDAHGNWSFAVPQYAALPADAQAAADDNAGWLNVEAIGLGYATAGQIPVGAVATRSAWVGTSTQTQSPDGISALAQPAAIMRPDGPAPAPLTAAAAAASYAAVNDPTTADSNGNPTGNPDYAYPAVPTDQYGYQNPGGGADNYNPNIASDGITDVTHAAITPAVPSSPSISCGNAELNKDVADYSAWTILGEYHSNWDDMGWFAFTTSASSKVGVEVSANDENFGFSGFVTMTNSSGISLGKGNDGVYNSHQVQVYVHYRESYWVNGFASPGKCYTYYQWEKVGIVRSPGGTYSRLGAKINPDQNNAQTRWRTDGCTALNNLYKAIPKNPQLNNYWFADPWPETGIELTHDAGLTYGDAATIKFSPPADPNTDVSVAVSAETDHAVATEQGVAFDDGNGMNTGPGGTAPTRPDPWPPFNQATDTKHFFWGSNGGPDFNGGAQPKVFYNC